MATFSNIIKKLGRYVIKVWIHNWDRIRQHTLFGIFYVKYKNFLTTFLITYFLIEQKH